jgi:hypothetical protein
MEMTKARTGSDKSWREGKGALGIDDNKGSDFTKRHTRDPWERNPPRDDKGLRSISARTKQDDNYLERSDVGIDDGEGEGILRRVDVDFENGFYSDKKFAGTGTQRRGTNAGNMKGAYDIFDDVTENQHEVGGPYVSRTGPIKSRGQD